MGRRAPRRFPPVNLDDVREVARLGEAIVRLEEAIERQGSTIEHQAEVSAHASEQRAQIVELLRAVDTSVAGMKAAVTALDSRISKIEETVKVHEQERQQTIGRRALLLGAVAVGASLIGGAAGAITVARALGGNQAPR